MNRNAAAELLADGVEIGNVPCDGCTRCCHGDAIRLLPEDDAAAYETEPHFLFPGHLMLAHRPNGDCVYVTEKGCAIHDRRPRMCYSLDCRLIARVYSFTEARKADARNEIKLEVWRRGRDLLREIGL